jgi:hypothetical protein
VRDCTLPNEVCSIHLGERRLNKTVQAYDCFTNSAVIVTVWFVVITGTIFAWINIREGRGQGQSTHLTIGGRGKEENGGGEGAEENLGGSQQKVSGTGP